MSLMTTSTAVRDHRISTNRTNGACEPPRIPPRSRPEVHKPPSVDRRAEDPIRPGMAFRDGGGVVAGPIVVPPWMAPPIRVGPIRVGPTVAVAAITARTGT